MLPSNNPGRQCLLPPHARDLLWAHNSPELWDLLVTQRGWSPLQYATHLARTLISALLP